MNDNQLIEIMTEVAKEQSKEIYNDGFKGATQEGGQALETIVGLFNNVVLYPLKKLNMTYKYKLEQFGNDMALKGSKIPKENIIEPPISIVGPTIEALKYTIDTEDLREMYMNLLTSSMDIEKIQYAHPSYVEIIRQLTSLDAQVLKRIQIYSDKIRCSRIDFAFDGRVYTSAMPRVFAPDILKESDDPFLVSSSIENLCRLGILVHYDIPLKNKNYNDIKNHSFVIGRYNFYKHNAFNSNFEIVNTEETIDLTDFGKNFIKACLG